MDTLPYVGCFRHRGLIDDFWGNKFRCAIFAVLSLLRCDLQCIAEITDSDVIAMWLRHEDVIRLMRERENI